MPQFTVADPPGMPQGLPPWLADASALHIRPWHDEVVDAIGFDPRSTYVERFWLSVLGPSTTWLLRRLAAAFDRDPTGFDLPLAPTARELGLGDRGGRHSPFMRALWRCQQFELARVSEDLFEVRRRLPPLSRRQVARLPEPLQEAHHAWQEARIGAMPAAEDQRRARQLAVALLEIDPDVSAAEQRLIGCGLHPAAASEAAAWAGHTTLKDVHIPLKDVHIPLKDVHIPLKDVTVRPVSPAPPRRVAG